MDMSSEMIHALLPVYLVTVLGASMTAVGAIEGIAEATASITKIFSGALSDWFGRRKWLTGFGYGLAALTKPVFPMATSIDAVVAARFIDRVGKGIRGAPRDALIADLTPPEVRGASFGLRQSLDTVGAFLGPFLAMALMWFFANDIKAVFWFAVLPAFLSFALVVFGVNEPDGERPQKGSRFPLHFGELERLGRSFWMVVAIASLFTLARFSEAFLVLKSQASGLPLALIPAVLVVMNITYALAAYPAGVLSDQGKGRIRVLVIGLLTLVGADLVLAVSEGLAGVTLGTALWGLHMGLTQGVISALVADSAPSVLRGTAFGFLNLITGLALLLASVLAGLFWDIAGPTATFLAGAAFAAVALIALLLVRQWLPAPAQ
jgi:MFS family permease